MTTLNWIFISVIILQLFLSYSVLNYAEKQLRTADEQFALLQDQHAYVKRSNFKRKHEIISLNNQISELNIEMNWKDDTIKHQMHIISKKTTENQRLINLINLTKPKK